MQNKNLNIANQNGAALITALVLLVLLTMLGLSNMSSTSMQEKMAANSQTINRAFQAASSGIEIVYNDAAAFDTRLTEDTDGTSSDSYADASDPTKEKYNTSIGGSSSNKYDAVVTYNSVFVQDTKPPRGSGWDSNFSYYYFDLSATGCLVADNTDTDCSTSAIASNTLHQGAYQVGKAQ
jgi:Tfp pilus assembly protein PilX